MTVDGILDDGERSLVGRCGPYSMASAERLIATADAVDHVVRRDIPGALVECGVWKGGSVLAMILTLQKHGVRDRDVFLFDTFRGMTEPTDADVSAFDAPATQAFARARVEGRRVYDSLFGPDVFDVDTVRRTVSETGYPPERIHFVVGDVAETLPTRAPSAVALLRLDTDWYESTMHELETLYPLLSRGGVLIVDDYGHWQGAQRAFEEYFSGRDDRPLLGRTDYTGRMGVRA